MILYAHMTFTSKKLMEVEVVVDVEVLSGTSLETKRVAVGYFCFVSMTADRRIINVPNIKVSLYNILMM